VIFRRDFWIIIVTISYLLFCTLTLTNIASDKYQLDRTDLRKIDNVKMLSRAYYQYAAKSNGPSGIEFVDELKKKFVITGARFKAIEGGALYDTLRYSNLEFSVLTDRQGAKASTTSSDDNIEVYDVIIGGKSFIDLAKVNDAEKSRWFSLLIFFSIVYVICLIFYFKKRMED
jgi:hypothetical protein